MRVNVKEGERIPKRYGIAYKEFTDWTVVCYPVGIHWIVRIHKDFTWFIHKLGVPGWDLEYEAESRQIYIKAQETAQKTIERERKYWERIYIEAGRILGSIEVMEKYGIPIQTSKEN